MNDQRRGSANLRRARQAILKDGREMSYRDYIVSAEWRSRHKDFLKKGQYRDSLFPWIKIGRGKRYACHHTTYRHLGQEVYGEDVLIYHPWVHRWLIHGVASGFKLPGKQRKYPNFPQQIIHGFSRLPILLKIATWVFLVTYLVVSLCR